MTEKRRWIPDRYGRQHRPGFDVLFGIVAPLVCLALDPFVFRSADWWFFDSAPMFGRFQIAAYLFIGIQCVMLAIGLRTSPRPVTSAFLCTGLLIGSVGSFALGVVLAPFSLVGALYLIGLLGLTPFVTSFVYFRIAARHLRVVRFRRPSPIAVALIAFAVAAGAPLATYLIGSVSMSRALSILKTGDPGAVPEAVELLERRRAFVYEDDLVFAWYESGPDPQFSARIASAYRRLTDQEIDVRWGQLAD